MGIIFNRRPCKNCGNTTLHRECFSGGTKTTLDLDPKTISNIHKKVELNRAQGKPLYAGLSSSQKKIYLSQDKSRRQA